MPAGAVVAGNHMDRLRLLRCASTCTEPETLILYIIEMTRSTP